jgi:predicted ATPase
MAISRVAISNFKSFSEVEVDLGDFTVLVGANSSGKSNFINVFRFLRDITQFGLDNALSLQGGSEFVRNVSLGASAPLVVEVTSTDRVIVRRHTRLGPLDILTDQSVYRFALSFHKRGSGYSIAEDKLVQHWVLSQRSNGGPSRAIGEATFTIESHRGKAASELNLSSDLAEIEDDLLPKYFRVDAGRPGVLLVEQPHVGVMPYWTRNFEETAIYDIDPKLPKKAVPVTGKLELEEDGSNLAIVLNAVLSKRRTKGELVNLMADLLPFIDNIGIEKFADTSLLFKVMERYAGRQYFPASLISDGTINVTALVLALFFERSRLTVIEEPERNIHPYLISKIVGLMKDAAAGGKTQLIISTHNPDLVAHASLENLLLLRRNKDGFSEVSRPRDSPRVRAFLESELGVEHLFAQNLLAL